MLNNLVTRKSASTLPLLALDEAGYRKWRRSQGKAVVKWLKANGYEPIDNRVTLIPGTKGPKLALLGTSDPSMWAFASAGQRLPAGRYRIEGLSDEKATDAAIGWALSAYRFDRYKSPASERPRELIWPDAADRAEVERTVGAIGMVRDLVNTPAEDLGPADMAIVAKDLAKAYGARIALTSGKRLAEGFPAIHAVGRGSPRKPVLIDITAGSPKHPKLTLVGKGVCFDSGGLNLKSTSGMRLMKKDMGGAALVLGLTKLILDAALPVRLRVLIPAVENMPGEGAYRPSDVLTTRKGLSVEVTNTDAEGRLVLADALALADVDEPELLIDIATLTGSARLAVGPEITPFFCSDNKVADELARSGRARRDSVWRMPLHRGYRRHLDSRIADLKNAASTHMAGSVTAALFLNEFVEHAAAWLHLDAFAWNDYARPGRPVGGEATALRALWEFVQRRYPRHEESAEQGG